MSTTLSPVAENLETVPPAAAGSLLGPVSGELVLRMNNGPHSGRIVRLAAGKCSIGSAPECTLRLRGAGLDPVHCLILRGARQTVVRRWAADTRLNDRRFEDVPLHAGDRLAVGPIEMQVLALPGEVREAAQAARRLDLELAASTARLERLGERLDLANRQGRRRLRAVLARLRKYQLRLSEVETRRSRLTEEQEALAAERARLHTAEQTLAAERTAWEAEVRRSHEAAAAATLRREELDRRAAELARREADLSARTRELSDRAAAASVEEARLQTARTELERARTEADRARAAAVEGQARLAALDAEATTRRIELERQAALLTERQSSVAARTQELDARAERLAAGERTLVERQASLAAEVAALRKQAEELARREAEIGSRGEAVEGRGLELVARESALASEQAALRRQAEAVAQRETEVGSRCEALKNHWTVLTERESKLERDRAALAEREQQFAAEHAAAAEQLGQERAALAAIPPTPPPSPAEPSAPTVIVDPTAVQRANELERALELARADLAAMQAEQTRRETALHDVQAAHDLEIRDRRAAVEAEAADLSQRRATVELAARTLERWGMLVEEWTAAAAELAAQPAPTPVVEDAALAFAERQALADRLEIEKLEAELKTWRDEARLWKSRFDEASFGPKGTDRPDDDANEVEAAPPEQPETDEAEDTLVAAATTEIEPPAEEVADESETEVADEAEAEVAAVAEPEIVADATPAAEVKQESAAEVLRRLGLTAVLDDEPAAAEPVQRAAPTPPPAPPRPTPAPQPEPHAEGEESLDVYMQQLFQRLGVNQGAKPDHEEKAKPVAAAAVAEAAQPEEKPAAPALPPLQPGEFKARSSAAERRSDLSALRELANFQAKTAITTHQIHRKSTGSKSKLTIALLALGMGLYGSYDYFIQGRDIAKYAAGAGMSLALLYVLQSLGLKLQAKKSARSLDDVIQKSAARGTTKDVGAE